MNVTTYTKPQSPFTIVENPRFLIVDSTRIAAPFEVQGSGFAHRVHASVIRSKNVGADACPRKRLPTAPLALGRGAVARALLASASRLLLARITLAPAVAEAFRSAQVLYGVPDYLLDALAVAAAEQSWTAQEAEDQVRCAHAWGPRYRVPAKRRMDNASGEHDDPSWPPVDVAIACGYMPPVLSRGVARPSRRALRRHRAEAIRWVILKARSAPHSELARRLRAECPGLSLGATRKTSALRSARTLRLRMTAQRAWVRARKISPAVRTGCHAGQGRRRIRTADPPADSDDPDAEHPVPADSPAAPLRDEPHWPIPANDWPVQTEPDADPTRKNETDPNGAADATLTPEEKSVLDFLVEQAFRRLLERKAPSC